MIASLKKTFFCLAVAMSIGAPAFAIQASPWPFQATQPDGTEITLHIRGDEFYHWYEDIEGYTVVNDRGAYLYATTDTEGKLAPTRLLVGKSNPAAAGLARKLTPRPEVIDEIRSRALPEKSDVTGKTVAAPRVPANGSVKNIVILMRFSNHGARTLPTNANYNTLFNSTSPDATYCPTGSVRAAYLENSYGAVTLDSTIYGWVTLPQTEQYYANNQSGLGTKVWEAIEDACELADPLIDFSQYDEDNDGEVDSIAFVHSGYGAEWGGTDSSGSTETQRIWSHRWSLGTDYVSAEGVRVEDYHINPGLWSTSGSAIGRIGVICHESGHFFGLPDLYDTDGTSNGIGSWCMMANSWGFDGSQLRPPHFSAWCKMKLGWSNPQNVISPGVYTVLQGETNPSIWKIRHGYTSQQEYLLVENRQKVGLDVNIPQGGLAIWHIDEARGNNTQEGFPGQAGWPTNNRHYRIALLQADGLYELEKNIDNGDSGDLYRSTGVSAINSSTTPNTNGYTGGVNVNTGNSLSAISASGPSMTFTFGSSSGTPSFPANDIHLNAFQVPAAGGTITGNSNVNGSKQQGEPFHVNQPGGASVWWMWTALGNGNVEINTENSSFDTILAVYTGNEIESLNLVAEDDDSGIGTSSKVTFVATFGTLYRIAIDGFDGATGNITLNVIPSFTPTPVEADWELFE